MIKDLKELTEFLKICRKQGVNDIKFEGLSVSFGELPRKSRREGETDADDDIQSNALTDEQLLFYSVPQQDPINENQQS